MLSAQLERMKEELKMNLDEIPRSLFPTTIETPFLGTIQDTHTVRLDWPSESTGSQYTPQSPL
jgi:hypothetical protein